MEVSRGICFYGGAFRHDQPHKEAEVSGDFLPKHHDNKSRDIAKMYSSFVSFDCDSLSEE